MKNFGLRTFNGLLFWIGNAIFIFVIAISYKQFSHHKLSLKVNGFELNSGGRYAISGILKNGESVYYPQNNLSIIQYSKSLPFVGEFANNQDGEWGFVLSPNIYSKKNDNDNNILFPKVYLKKNKDILIEPRAEVNEKQLIDDHLVFLDRSNGMILLELWIENIEGRKVVKSSTLFSSPLNLTHNGQMDSIKIIGNSNYILSSKEPTKILLLSSNEQNTFEELLTIRRVNANKYKVNVDQNEFTIKRSNSTIFLNGWLISFVGIYTWVQIITLIFTFILGWAVFYYFYNSVLKYDDSFYTRVVETRAIRMLMIFILFSVLSIIFINHQWLSTEYKRTVGFSSMLILMTFSWLLVALAIREIQHKSFFENVAIFRKKEKPFEYRNYDHQRYLGWWFFSLIVILIIYSRTVNERVILISSLGIPVLHISKILVCVFVFIFKKVIFKGDLVAHLFIWSLLIINSILTGDFSSLIFSLFSYLFVSLILTNKIILPNFFRLSAWLKFYQRKSNELPHQLLASKKVLGSYFVISILFLVVLFLGGFTKIYRFMLPYISPDSAKLINLNNQHKETYAKMFWSSDFVTQHLGGTWGDFRTVNFFTTWHSDLAILSWVQYGGGFIILLLAILVFYLLYDTFYNIFGIRSIINDNMIKELEKGVSKSTNSRVNIQLKIIYENIFIYFLSVYLIIQTIYPFFSNFNILPMIGSPTPGLSVSIIEYILTPIFILAIYFYTGRLIHNNKLIMPEKYSVEEKKHGHWFNEKVLKNVSSNSFLLSIFILCIYVVSLLVVVKFVDKDKFNKESYSLEYISTNNPFITKVLDEVNQLNLDSKKDIDRKLIEVANRKLNSVGWFESKFENGDRNKRELIKEIRSYIFQDDLMDVLEDKPSISFSDETKLLSQNSNSLTKNRRIFKSNVVANLSYKNYFDEKSSKEIGDFNYPNDTRFVLSNNQIYIQSSALTDFSNQHFVARHTENLPNDNYVYDGLTNKINYKIINGNRVKVLTYPSLGDIDLTSDTYDADLQAIITSYLAKYINERPDLMKVASVVIAENKTGRIKVMASAPNFQNMFGNTALDKFKEIQRVSTFETNLKGEKKAITIPLISWFDKDNKNLALAQSMIGSTVKPIYTFSALANSHYKQFSNNRIIEGIKNSDNRFIIPLFNNQYENDTFQQNLYNYFDLKMFEDVSYSNSINNKISFLSNTAVIFAGEDLNFYHKKYDLNLTSKEKRRVDRRWKTAEESAALGQGSINKSLTSLVRDYIRINERKSVILKLQKKDAYQPSDVWFEEDRVNALYDGMSAVLSNGTARSTVGEVLLKYQYNLNDFKGKTGTVQFPKLTDLGKEGKNKCSYMMLITPTHTIGVSLFGELPSGGRTDRASELIHARGILEGLIDLLHNWRNGMYLKQSQN